MLIKSTAVAVAFGATLALALPSFADGLRTPPINDAVVAKECSACHMLYPAGLLPARSWGRLVGDLKNHFGDNAELDTETTKKVLTYLALNAADEAGRNPKILRGLPTAAEPTRITDLPWWKRKHEKKDRAAPATLTRKGAKFKGDCAACHEQAAKGYFEDD
jgi:mono/diheme cytochrome c family protein